MVIGSVSYRDDLKLQEEKQKKREREREEEEEEEEGETREKREERRRIRENNRSRTEEHNQIMSSHIGLNRIIVVECDEKSNLTIQSNHLQYINIQLLQYIDICDSNHLPLQFRIEPLLQF